MELTGEHWEVIRTLREHYAKHGAQASVRDMIRHFREVWGAEKGTNRYLHRLFPRGGPQKQGNRLAGLRSLSSVTRRARRAATHR